MTKTPKIPEGYRQNANGDLVLIENIKEIDLLRDELVVSIAARSREKSGELAEFRAQVMEDIQSFVAESAKRFKAKWGGTKGNLSLLSFDGQFKVLVAQQDKITFDERLQVAKSLLDQCIKRFGESSGREAKALLNRAFQVDKAGNVSVRRVLDLRQLDFDDKDWKRAMEAISESIQVTGSKTYIRVYERDSNGEYKPISLDMAGV